MSNDKRGKQAMFDMESYDIKSNTQNAQNTQATHTTREVQQVPNRVQKNPRINMAFYDDNLEYLREAAWKNRMSVTQYVNYLVAEDRKQKGM